ncbi:MAG: hypothetical protein ACRECR_07365, partial [Thermoplasmata archaeon]
DGLFAAARLMAGASRVALLLDPDRLPMVPGLTRALPDPAERLRIAGFGGDYELLAALPPASVVGARAALAPLDCPLTEIGRVVPGRGAWRTGPGGRSPLPPTGWDPFRPGLPGGGPERRGDGPR